VSGLNERIFRAINEWPDSFAPLTFFSIALNQVWVKVILGLLVVGMIVANTRTRTAAIQALLSVGLANLTTDQFKHFLPMNRPYQELAGVMDRVGATNNPGTASAHTANMTAVAFVFCYQLGWWGSPWVVIAILTALSRVYVGAHYPYQVVLGCACGIVASYLVTKGWERIQAKRSSVLVSETPNEVPPEN